MEKKKQIWEDSGADLALYMPALGLLGQSMNLPGKSGLTRSIAGYKISQEVLWILTSFENLELTMVLK